MSTKKKIEKVRINRNSSPEISHTIKKIKENEKKYSTILVIFFMIIFIIIGYFSLSIHTDINSSYQKAYLEDTNSITLSTKLVTLTNKNILEESKVKETTPYKVQIHNKDSVAKKYKVLLVEDENVKEECGCKEKTIDKKWIHYSINKKESKSLIESNNNILTEFTIPKEGDETINISLWLDKETNKSIENHFHAYFIIEEA